MSAKKGRRAAGRTGRDPVDPSQPRRRADSAEGTADDPVLAPHSRRLFLSLIASRAPHDPACTPRSRRLFRSLAAGWVAARDLIYPPRARCPGCGDLTGTDDGWLCPRCAEEYAPEYACERDTWAGSGGISASYTALSYDHVARGLIHSLKFRFERRLAARMADEMAAALRALAAAPPDCLVPVPLGRGRMRERGFNQAALLAAELGARIGASVCDCLVRTRETPRQSRLSGAKRRQGLAGAFECRLTMDGRRVLLVDDVITSGETVRHCAVTLRRAGAADVTAVALARARIVKSGAAGSAKNRVSGRNAGHVTPRPKT